MWRINFILWALKENLACKKGGEIFLVFFSFQENAFAWRRDRQNLWKNGDQNKWKGNGDDYYRGEEFDKVLQKYEELSLVEASLDAVAQRNGISHEKSLSRVREVGKPEC